MELSHGIIAKSGAALATPRYILEYRHRYLVKQGRAQYNPTLPNYVSLNDLVVPIDEDFCFKTAKTTISEYNTFLRLIWRHCVPRSDKGLYLKIETEQLRSNKGDN